MQVLVIGSGGREHALAWALAKSPSVTQVASLPGNPGMAALGPSLPGSAGDLEGVVQTVLAAAPGLVVVGPEAPLVAGLGDRLRAAGLAVFGASAAAARIEGSKVFAKELFRDAGIPTAAFECCDDPNAADAYLRRVGAPIVVKADGLAAGKGALICPTLAEAHRAVDLIMRERCFGDAGAWVVIEECMTGPEVSVMALVDGETVKLLPISQDHKRALDGDAGLNTGGMGAYSPVPQIPASLIDEILATCLQPTVDALAERGAPYQGVLYGGYMLTPDGVRTVEYNCRFGDPETQAVLPLLTGDFGEVCHATATGRLREVAVGWTERAAVCVVMASGGYPESYRTGLPITGLEEAAALDDVVVFHAGTKAAGGEVLTAGGRVLGVTGLGDSLPAAAARAYAAVERIGWEGRHYRRDIAAQALRPAGG